MLVVLRIQKKYAHVCKFHYVVMPMTTSEILKSVELTKTYKSRYLKNETFFLQIIEFVNYRLIKGYLIAKNSFAVEVT